MAVFQMVFNEVKGDKGAVGAGLASALSASSEHVCHNFYQYYKLLSPTEITLLEVIFPHPHVSVSLFAATQHRAATGRGGCGASCLLPGLAAILHCEETCSAHTACSKLGSKWFSDLLGAHN